MEGERVALIPKSLVDWGKRLNLEVDTKLVVKALRQYLKHIDQTRTYKRNKRGDHDWLRRKRRQNIESAARRKADKRGNHAEG